jgi:serine/threonine protein phosphatase PrpC
MSPPDIQIEVFGKTDVGLIRDHNEDNFLVADLGGGLRRTELERPETVKLGDQGALLLVCDGMGGAAAGEVASRMAVDSIFEVLAQAGPNPRDGFARQLRRAIEVANDRIFQQSRDNQNERGMGTTCTAAALVDETLVVAQIGDSRCYVLRNEALGQVTKDQSLAWQLIEAGAMTPEEAKAFEHANIILQALGVQDRVEVVLSQVPLRRGDLVLLCSDGLHGPVGDDEIQEVMRSEPDLQKAADALLQKALERDGPDNITVVLARFQGEGLQPPAAEDRVGFAAYDPGRDPSLEIDPTPLPETAGLVLGEARGGGDRDGGGDAGGGDGDGNGGDDDGGAGAAEVGARDEDGSGDRGTGAGSDKKASANARDDGRSGGGLFGRGGRVSGRNGRSVVALFFLALLAAAASGILVLKCEREQVVRSEGPGGGR